MNRVMRSDILKKKKGIKKRVQCVDGSSPSASTVCHLYLHEQAWEKLSVRTFTAQAELSHLTGLVHVNSKAGTVLILSPMWPVPSRPPKHCCTLLTCWKCFIWQMPRCLSQSHCSPFSSESCLDRARQTNIDLHLGGTRQCDAMWRRSSENIFLINSK